MTRVKKSLQLQEKISQFKTLQLLAKEGADRGALYDDSLSFERAFILFAQTRQSPVWRSPLKGWLLGSEKDSDGSLIMQLV